MNNLIRIFWSFFLIIFIHIYSCNTAREYSRPEIPADSVFANTKPVDSSTIASLEWENFFADTLLKSLIREGIVNNPDMNIAIKRIDEAQALLGQRGDEMLPSLGIELNGGITRLSENATEGVVPNNPIKNYKISLASSWEADIWGKLRSAKRGAYADLIRSYEVKKSVQTLLVANIAKEYYNLLLFRSQEKIILATIKNREESLETVKLMKQADMLTEAAVKQSEAQLYSARILLPQLKKLINFSENAINLYMGRTPRDISVGDLDNSPRQFIDTLTGYPSQLLTNRPDVSASEQSLVSSFENTNVARANFYPSLNISAALGLEGFSPEKIFLFPGSIFANAMGQIIQPIFNKGKNEAELKVAIARQQIAAYQFRNTFLTAVAEVSNALFNYKISGEIIDLYTKQTESLALALEYSEELLKSGLADYLEVLRAEDELLSSSLQLQLARAEQLRAGIELYRSLGGGWK